MPPTPLHGSCHPFDGCQHHAAPLTGCRTSEKALLLLKRNAADPSKDKLIWKWIKGDEILLAELGDPTTTTDYALCLFDGNDELIADVNVPSGAPTWHPTAGGYKFKSPAPGPDGAQHVLIKSGTAGKSKALVKGKGAALPDPPLGALTLPVTAQLMIDTVCLEAEFDPADLVKDEATQFKAKW